MSRRRGPTTGRAWWRRRPAEAGLVAVALFALALLVGYRVLESRSESSAPVVSQEVLDEGEALYRTSCATCHGDEGEGFAQPSIPAPPLDGSAHSWHHSDEQIIGLIRSGGSMMPAVGSTWSDDQIEAVLAYVKNDWDPWQREAQTGTIGE